MSSKSTSKGDLRAVTRSKSERTAMKLLGQGAREQVSAALNVLHGLFHCMQESDAAGMWGCQGDDLTVFLAAWRDGVEKGLYDARTALLRVEEQTGALLKLGGQP